MNIDFDFSRVCTQGAFLTSFSPCSVDEYLHFPAIPKQSNYHLVSCCPQLETVKRMNVWPIVAKYLAVSAKRQDTLIDLCLPYYDSKLKKSYLARYILLRGQLRGVRLNTGTSDIFRSWPKHKSKTISIALGGTQHTNVLIGEFSINLINVRIGLLFSSQLPISANGYIKSGFDMITLLHQSCNYQRVETKRKEISTKMLLFEVAATNSFSFLEQSHLVTLKEGSLPRRPRNQIFLGFYELERIYATKQLPIAKDKTKHHAGISSLQLDLRYAEQETIPDLYCEDDRYQMTFTNPLTLRDNALPPNIEGYVGRLLRLLQFSERGKVVLVLEQSPTVLCFLYVLERVFGNHLSSLLPRIFQILYIGSQQFKLFLIRIDFPLKHCLNIEQEKDFACQQEFFLHYLNKISLNNYEWIPVISSNKILQSAVKLINQRHASSKARNEAEQMPILQTWISSPFFSPEQLDKLFLSEQVKSFISNESYHQAIWNNRQVVCTFVNPIKTKYDDLIDVQLSKTATDNVFDKNKFQTLLRCDNLLFSEFAEWHQHLYHAAGGQIAAKQKTFAHFIYRKITVFQSSYQPNNTKRYQPNFMEDLLAMPKDSLLELFSFFRQDAPSLTVRFQHSQVMKEMQQIQQNNSKLKSCHLCKGSYPNKFMFACLKPSCGYFYCYQCLYCHKVYEAEKLLTLRRSTHEEIGEIKKCVACQGACPINCLECRQRAKNQKNQSSKQNDKECDICLKEQDRMILCINKDCNRRFCRFCLVKSNTLRKANNLNNNWICSDCQGNFYCGLCESKICEEVKEINSFNFTFKKHRDEHDQMSANKQPYIEEFQFPKPQSPKIPVVTMDQSKQILIASMDANKGEKSVEQSVFFNIQAKINPKQISNHLPQNKKKQNSLQVIRNNYSHNFEKMEGCFSENNKISFHQQIEPSHQQALKRMINNSQEHNNSNAKKHSQKRNNTKSKKQVYKQNGKRYFSKNIQQDPEEQTNWIPPKNPRKNHQNYRRKSLLRNDL